MAEAVIGGITGFQVTTAVPAPEGCELAMAHQIMSLLKLFMPD
ncbi:hypothetical protein ACVFVO_11430 [Advenella kashmirensis]